MPAENVVVDASSIRKPVLIRIATWPSLVIGAFFLVGALATALGCADTSALRGSALGEWSVSLWIVQAAVVGGLLFAIGYGFRGGKVWSRPLAISYWVAGCVFSAINGLASGIGKGSYFFGITSLIGLGVAWWYFFGKANVVAYYRELTVVESGARA